MTDVLDPSATGGETTRKLAAPAARHLARVAARLFASRGFDATSVREIVEAAGVAKPMLYYYFGSKEGLARAIVQEPLGELVNQIREVVSAEMDAVRCLERVVEAHYAFCREDPDRSRFIYAQFFGPPGSRPAHDMECEKHDLTGLTEAASRRLVEAGIVAPARLDAFNAIVHGLIMVPTLGFLYKNTPLGQELAGSLVRELLAGFDQRRPSQPTNKPMKRWFMLAPASCLGVVLAASSGCSHAGAEASGKVRPAIRTIPVTVAPLERRTVERTVDVVGSLRGWEQVTVGAKRGGRVVKVVHDMGDRVKPGEPLIELDTVDAKLAYDLAQSKYLAELMKLGITEARADEFVKQFGVTEELLRGKHAEDAIDRVPGVIQMQVARDRAMHNLTRQRNLSKKGASTAQEMEDAENEYLSQVAACDNARFTARNVIAMAVGNRVARDQASQTLADMIVRVPALEVPPPGSSAADKVVYAITKRSVSEGQMVKEGETVCELVIEDPLRLWTSVPERYADEVQVGQPVRLSVAANASMTFTGKVVRINPSVDPTSRTFQVETLVPNERRLLRPGGFAKATIITDSRSMAATVPIEAIVRFAGVTKILVIENNVARAINDIVTGAEGQGWVEITGKGIPEKADVVVTGQSQLADGTPVVIRTPEPPEPPGSHGATEAAAAVPAKAENH